MIPEIKVIPDNLNIYMRVGNKNQDNSSMIILKKCEAKKLVNDLINKIERVPNQLLFKRSDS